MKVEALVGTKVIATTTTDRAGQFAFPDLTTGTYTVRLTADNFTELSVAYLARPGTGHPVGHRRVHLDLGRLRHGPHLRRPGRPPREALEAASVDGATERQVFRRVTIPSYVRCSSSSWSR